MRTINTGFNSGLVENIASLLEEAYQAERPLPEVRYGTRVLENLKERGYNVPGLQHRALIHSGLPWVEDFSLPPDEMRVARTKEEGAIFGEPYIVQNLPERLERERTARMLRGDPA